MSETGARTSVRSNSLTRTISASQTSHAADAWEQSWQTHWSKVGLPGYELPIGGPGAQEREFLTQSRTPQKERARLKRISDEFERAFKALYALGPAVTVFGSARFKPGHPYYELARQVGAELARAGFATLTGGGPGIMEAANRGAHLRPSARTAKH
jgi:SLOG cluster4 family